MLIFMVPEKIKIRDPAEIQKKCGGNYTNRAII